MEAWGPDQKWNTSWCHPWSSSPIYFYTAEFMGIKSEKPGFCDLIIDPKVPKGVDFMTLSLPTPHGTVKTRYERKDGCEVYTIKAPDKINVRCISDSIVFKRIKE